MHPLLMIGLHLLWLQDRMFHPFPHWKPTEHMPIVSARYLRCFHQSACRTPGTDKSYSYLDPADRHKSHSLPIPVSYTHLDVYKRQTLTGEGERMILSASQFNEVWHQTRELPDGLMGLFF